MLGAMIHDWNNTNFIVLRSKHFITRIPLREYTLYLSLRVQERQRSPRTLRFNSLPTTAFTLRGLLI